ncbi:hypothetical protein A2368_02610 [Candidatus Collierbacteria bacterium RIFOXYB1_FULL_49_13]|uniref:YprB ribonuclease H-like domain-containing protein n=1 Tax=Candidatus Collierbacteria bacterium RIFOXYB1_FULL_49_13 TaxID=1817728 RepID=A0A1F5FJ12_9BACT|nr:MAG: hypothetical protein A2368_02610 [Candidatus Collierbacteria bacterium RIFOXYB1_FULL_49_13]
MVEVFFDIETRKLFDQIPDREKIADLGVSIVSVYRRVLDTDLHEVEGEMKSFWEQDLPLMWPWFEGAERIIGFNSVRFDVPVLAPWYHRDLHKLPHFDLLEKVKERLGFRIKLDNLAEQTLGKGKSADGLMAVAWWNKGDEESLINLKKYCEMDVEVTRDLYDTGLKTGKLKYRDQWGQVKEFEVDFGYPKTESDEPQLVLF